MIKNGILIIAVLLLLGCTEKFRQKKNDATYREVDSLIKLSNNTSFTDSIRTLFLSKANNQIYILKNDSLKAHFLIRTAYSSLLLGKFKEYGKTSKQILKFSSARKDTTALTRAYSYLGYYYQFEYKADSAYYFYNKALQLFKLRRDLKNEGGMLLSMATIQENVKDYTGSEINTLKAISRLKDTDEYRSLYLAYNNLGVVYNQLNLFDLAIKSNEEAIEYLQKLKNEELLMASTLNNAGRIYVKQHNYVQAKNNFIRGLKIKGLKTSRPKTYAMLLSNLGYTKFKLGNYTEALALYNKALKIRDSLQIKDGQVASNQKISEFYLSRLDTVKALQHILIANSIAKKINYNDGLLESYKLLAKISEGNKGQQYLNKYISLSDSLQQQERIIREKFTRIAYQTDEVIQENKKVQKENYFLIISLIIFAAFSTLIYFLIRQRSKSKELLFTQKQDKSNVEIYNLMLSQQKMFNEGSVKEKNRISRDLHDSVLSRLFGARLSLDTLNEGGSKKDIYEREKSINELQSVEEEIREISHNLKSKTFNNESSFKELIEQLIIKQSKIINFEYQLNLKKDINWGEISNNIKINCYRILQEAIQNINKHSKAKKVKVSFTKKENGVIYSIEDDGIGFNSLEKSKGIGLKNIRSRVKDLGGKVTVNSEKNIGTIIIIEISLI